jgi:hypothetical protein
MRKIVFVLLLFVVSIMCFAYSEPELQKPEKTTISAHKEVISFSYDGIEVFIEHKIPTFRVEIDGRYGLLDTNEKAILPTKYQEIKAWDLKRNRYIVRETNLYGIISSSLDTLFPFKYSNIEPFNDSSFIVRLDSNGVVKYDTVMLSKRKSNRLSEKKSDFEHGDNQSYSILWWNKDSTYAKISQDIGMTSLSGFIDSNGVIIVPPGTYGKDTMLISISEGFLKFYTEQKYGFINLRTNKLLPNLYDCAADNFKNGVARVVSDYQYGLIDTSGNYIVTLGKYDIICSLSEGLYAFAHDEKYGFLNSKGDVVIPAVYEINENSSSCIDEFGFQNGRICLALDEKYGYIDTTGKIVIPFEYDKLSDFRSGLAAFRATGNKLWGYIGETNRIRIQTKYPIAKPFIRGKAIVGRYSKEPGDKNRIFSLIDTMGNTISEFGKCQDVIDIETHYETPPYVNIFAVKRSNLWGFADSTGKMLQPCSYIDYRVITPYYILLYKETTTGSGREQQTTCYSGYMNSEGLMIVPVEYECFKNSWDMTAGYIDEEASPRWFYIKLKKNNKYGVVKLTRLLR